ncbi:hypothetical protein [Streptomyces sp. NPDC127084]|uniref:hypothetical protein n=1 Tax=Streptomyces sp. NPDC127084 TaxID=3347133 RepID=UPI00365ADB45
MTATEWPGGELSTFWSQHPFFTGSLSSVLFLLLGATLVQDWVARRDESRLRLIILVACGSLARAPLAQRRMMWFLLNGGDFVEDRDFRQDRDLSAQIKRTLTRNNLPEVAERLALNNYSCDPSTQRRLEILARDRDWLIAAYSLLRGVSHDFRAVIARWAPLLSGTDRSAALLEELAMQADELTKIQVMVLPVAREQRVQLNDEEIQQLVQSWGRALANAVAMDEALTRLSGKRGSDWTSDGRKLLDPADSDRLRERDLRRAAGGMRLYA